MATFPVERETTLHGHSFAYTDSGSGQVLLFIHGLLGSRKHWAHLIDKLDEDFRVVVPDLFGHGQSAKPMGDYSLGAHAATIRDLLDRLGIDKVTVVGHSLGGGIALVFTYLFPERVEKIVLVASGGLGREVNPLLRAATLPGAELVLPLIASEWARDRMAVLGRPALRLLGRAGVRPSTDLDEVWTGFTSLGDAETRRAFLATTRAVIDPGGQTVTAHDYLPDATLRPALVVWGTNDRMIPAMHAASVPKSMPDCRIELFQGAGHFPHLDDPDRFVDIVREFVQEPVRNVS
jgi:pimeloyl-ACP methyl ester carboxylesterase